MMEKLKENSEKRHDKLKEIWENPDSVVSDPAVSSEEVDSEICQMQRVLIEDLAMNRHKR